MKFAILALSVLISVARINYAQDDNSLNFLRVDGVNGDSADPAHRNWIDVDSFEFSADRIITSNQLPGRLVYSDVEVVAEFDNAAYLMLDRIATGQTIRFIELERTELFANNRREVVEEWTLQNVVVTKFHRTNRSTIEYGFAFGPGEFCQVVRNSNGSSQAVGCTRFNAAANRDIALQPGDADEDFDFDQIDLVRVQQSGLYLSGLAATWGEGDWNGAPGGGISGPPNGDSLFDQRDIIAAAQAGLYLEGPYAVIASNGMANDQQTSVVYDASSGEVSVDVASGTQLTSINLDSAAGIFTGQPAVNLGGSFDNDTDSNIFKATFGSSFGAISFGNVAASGLSEELLINDLTVVGSLAGGGSLGEVDLIYVPEPTTLALVLSAFAASVCLLGRVSENFLSL